MRACSALWQEAVLTFPAGAFPVSNFSQERVCTAQAEALSALQNLGYAPADAARAVAEVAGHAPEAGTPEMIRAALRLLAPKE